MIDVTLVFNGYDFSDLLSTYNVTHEQEIAASVTAIDGTEYAVTRYRPIIQFTLMPLSDDQTHGIYNALSAIIADTNYTDPYIGERENVPMRVASSLESVFGLRSIDGNRYYKGGTIVLRQRTVL